MAKKYKYTEDSILIANSIIYDSIIGGVERYFYDKMIQTKIEPFASIKTIMESI